MKLFRFPLDHPVSVLAGFSSLFLFGLISLFLLPFEELPELDIPEYRVVTAMPGFPPAEMESLVTIPLENALSGVQGIRESEAFTGTGISLVILRLDWGEEPENTARELRECLDYQYPLLPRSCGKPLLLTRNSSRSPFMTLALKPAPGMEEARFHSVIDREFREELQKLEEISLAEFRGLRKSEVRVTTDAEALSLLGLSVGDCAKAVAASLVSRSAGRLKIDGREQLVKLEHPYHSPRELAGLRPFADIPLRLGEIARISRELTERSSLFLLDGEEAVGLRLYKNGGIGTLEASRKIRKRLPELGESFAGELQITLLRDYGEPLRASRNALFSALFWGLGGAILVLFLLYRNKRLPLVTALAVPATLLPVFFVLYLMDKGLNTLSFTGMIVGTGLIADADIVVLEDLESGAGDAAPVFSALFSSTLTTVLVFLPPLCLPGAAGVLFRDLIMTICLTVSFSLPVALFFTPALWKLCRRDGTARYAGTVPAGQSGIRRRYSRILGRTIDRPGLSLLLILFIPFSGLLSAALMPVELLPSPHNAPLIIRAELPGDMSGEDIRNRAAQLCSSLMEAIPDIRVSLESGRDESSLRDRGDPEASLNRLRLTLCPSPSLFQAGEMSEPLYRRKGEIAGILSAFPGISRVRMETERSAFSLILTPRRNIHFLKADNRKELKEAILPPGQIEEFGSTAPRLLFREDRDALNAAGIDRGEMIAELRTLLQGFPAGEIEGEGERYPVVLRGEEELKTDPSVLSRIRITGASASVPLGSLGSFHIQSETSLLCRSKRRPCLRLISAGPDIPHQEKPVRDVSRNELSSLPGLVLISLILLYLTLAMQSGSFLDALILMICPPLAMGGSLLSLRLFTPSLSFYAFMGVLILQGTALNTGILLMESFRGIEGEPHSDKILKAALLRLRPVLATTLTTTAALLPVILTGIIRGDRQADTAIALCGGLLISAPLIMLLLPPLYKRRRKLRVNHEH